MPIQRIMRHNILIYVALFLAMLVANSTQAGTYSDTIEAFNWVDDSGHTDVVWTRAPGGPANQCTGTSAAVDDDISEELPLGFTFTLGGVNYNTARIMSNGRVQFNNTYCGYGTQTTGTPRTYPFPMPDTRLLRTLRAYGGDLDPSAGGTVRYTATGIAPNRMFIVTWNGVREWSAAGSNFDVQVILHENGDFVYQYRTITNPSQGHPQIGWSISTDDYQLYDYTTSTALQNTAIRFSPHTPAPLAYYAMDELSWNGTPNEVLDTSGNSHHGDGVGNATTTGNGYQCRGGDFSSNSAAVDTKLNVRDQLGSKGTITFWFNSNSSWNGGNRMLLDGSSNNGNGNADKYFFLSKTSNGRLRFRLEDSNDTDLQAETSNNNYAAGSWHHIAITWDISNDADWMQIYIDGARRATNRGNRNGPLNITGLLGNMSTLYLGMNRTNGIGGNGYTNSSARGLEDESRIYLEVLSANQILADMNAVHNCTIMELHMDETAWNSTAGEVTDQSGYNNAGTAFNGLTTTAGYLCNGGDFDGIDDYIEVPNSPTLNGSNALTYAAWIKPDGWNGINQIFAKSVHGGGTGRSQMGIFSEGGVLKGRAETLNGRREVTTSLPVVGSWTHVALVFNGDTLTIYKNGVAQDSTSFAPTQLVSTTDPLMISKRYPNATYFFDGGIDEALVFGQALTAGDLAQIHTNYQNGLNWDGAIRVCPGLPLHHIEIMHDGNALTCNPEAITVRTCATADCSTLFTNNVSVNLTPTGWVGGDTQNVSNGSSTFQLRHTVPEIITLGVSNSNPAATNLASCFNTSDSSTSCSLNFRDTGFIYTIPNQISCTASNTINIAAVRKDLTTQQCIPAFANRNENINFWSSYVSPASGTNQVTLNNGSNNYLLDTATPGTAIPLNFDANGETNVTLTYPDAGQLTLNSQFSGTATESGLVMTGNATYATKPAKFYVYSDDVNSDCASASLACSPFRQAAQGFNLKVRAACADNTATPNFVHNGITLTHNLVAPVAGNPGTIGIANTSIGAGENGEHTISNQSVSEVGVFSFTAQLDNTTNYFGETVIGNAGSNTSVNVGRFFPSYFDVTRIHGCAAGAFTYSGQPFSVTATAYNANDILTQNYSGALGFAQPTTLSHEGDVTNFSNNVIPAASFSAVTPGAGTRNDVLYTFPLKETAPVSINLRAIDTDNVSSIGHTEESTDIHSGRISISNAFGSELIDLSVPATIQHYDGTDFVSFATDVCTTMSLSLAKVDGALNVGNGGAAGDTCIWDDVGNSGANNCSAAGVLPGPALLQYTEPPAAADFNLYLKPPGAGFTGNVDVTGNVDNWLQFDWNGTGLTDPTGRATFGIYRGDDRIIYWRERFE